MASCSGNGSRGHHKFTLNVWETGTNQSANTSTVSWSFVLSPIQSGWDWNISGISYSINVDGNVKSGSIQSYNGSSTVTIASGSKTIGHNNDGSKSIGFSFSVNDGAGKTYTPGNASGSGNLTLTKINRQAIVINATDFTDETNPTIYFNKSGGYRINARLEFGGTFIQRDNITNNGTYVFELTQEERDLLRSKTQNSNSMTVREVLGTCINSSSETHWSWKDKTMTIVNGNPIFNDFTYQDTNNDVTQITGNNQIIVKGLSTLQINIPIVNKMAAQKYATPVKYVATLDTLNGTAGYSDENDVSINLGSVLNGGTKRLSVRAYDSRNNSTEVYKDITVYDYNSPIINATAERENNFDETTIISINGTYSLITINDIEKNTITSVQYRYREKEGIWSSWTNGTFTASNGGYTVNDIAILLDSGKTFDIEVKVADSFSENVILRNVDVGKAIFLISSNQKNCYINNEPIINEEANNDNSCIKFYDGTMICCGKKVVNKAVDRTWGNIYTSGDFDPNITFAEEFSEIYSCTVSFSQANYSAWIGDLKYTKTGINNIQFFRGVTSNNNDYTINYIAIGKWK